MSVFIGYPSFMAYQMMKGKKGNNDGFPSIPGIVARYSASGLTNEQMAANPVWVDKTGNGHDIQLKNFSWKGMSGIGGYGDENHQTFYKFTLDDYVFIATPPGVKHMNFTFRVTGLQPGNKLTLAFFGTTNTVYGTWDKDGIYTVDADIVEAGTKDDPIPYAPPMEIFKDKYYTQSKVLYKCIRDSGQPLSHNLSDLVGNYVEKA